MTIDRLLRAAMKTLGIVDLGNEPEPEQYEDALETANMMLSTWANDGLVIYHIVTSSLTFVVGQSAYTVGSGGNFNISRPNRIIGGIIRDTSNFDTTLKVISRDEYNAILDKTVTGRPTKVYYYPAYPLGTLYFNYEADATYTLLLDALLPLTDLALDTDLTMPPEYQEAIKYNLAMRLAADYGVVPSADVRLFARQTYDALNMQPVPKAVFDGVPGVKSNTLNINIGY